MYLRGIVSTMMGMRCLMCFIVRVCPSVTQECQLYEYDGNYYCSEICSDGACDEGETCKTQDEDWCSNSRYLGCPTRRECS